MAFVTDTDLAATGAGQGAAMVGFIQNGTGAAPRIAMEKLRETVSVEDFGVVGDGVADDTAELQAALAAMAAGQALDLGTGKTFRISATLIFAKPIVILGGAKEQSKFLFAANGEYTDLGGGLGKVAMLFPHPDISIPVPSGANATRSRLQGFTVEMEEAGPSDLRGIVLNAPCYLSEVDVNAFGRAGFSIIAGDSTPLDGNANGSTLTNCTAMDNGGHGFETLGSDASQCRFDACRAFANGGWGFYEGGFLGNLYLSCEADNNAGGGFGADNSMPNTTVYLFCYAEINQNPLFSVNTRSLLLSCSPYAGANEDSGFVLAGLPSGDGYSARALTFAENAAVANVQGAGVSPGPFTRVGKNGFEHLPYAEASCRLQIRSLASTNYIDIYNDDTAVISFPQKTIVAGNISYKRPFMPNGFVVGPDAACGFLGAGTTSPVSGSFAAGGIWLHSQPIAGGHVGWVCVTGGSPGTWKAFGAIEP
ncbi:right-handed parallel beta-helix repeat-containing protein [Sphingomonas kyeonggiensis]|uniref:Rhamnogalacturonase A/B/Epimerase-like pectate lyase domain-containing protein n=1 Tax=Sphingomonas kyeonggiensis TaxID=1268553 RepID=A0A7W6NVN7_9SPHN|nr:right-handed parallel beta-helix repeat-containing protein [Sphingomonas kyeonggiensis]MBB4097328.1 hypothetical protein [Sphingomonas kyeonggiensis]